MNKVFEGFEEPHENWSKLPHVLVECLPEITSLAELKCILYVIRHTWGYKEYRRGKRITTDEFMHGRKRRNGTRIDNGTGLSAPSVRDGLDRAVEHGFMFVEVDDSDKARIEKFYSPNVKKLSAGSKNLSTGDKESIQRTEKETNRKILIKRNLEEGAGAPRVDMSTGEVLPSKNEKPAAVIVYHEVMHFWPHKSLYDLIVSAVGEDGLALQRWRDVLMQWIGRGYSPKNVEGVLDVFRAGWKKQDAKPKATKPAKPDYLGGKYADDIQH